MAVKPLIKKTGIVVMTYPEGIEWGDDIVKLVVGIAATGDEHLDILARIVAAADDEEATDKLVETATEEDLFKLLNGLE